MRKGREFLGLPILEAISGQRLGEVEDLIFDPENHAVSGFLIEKGNWLHTPKQVPVETVFQVQEDAIKVQSSPVAELAETGILVSSLNGKRVATAGGKYLGSIQDVVIDDSCFQVVGYEISDGFLSDLVAGRAIIDQPSIVTQSNHVLVVEDKLATIWDG